jgi:hypothetical protein
MCKEAEFSRYKTHKDQSLKLIFKTLLLQMLCLRLLEERLQISNIRVGGPCDNGIDLIGKWNYNTNILVQCKHINRKLQPSTIRELEGVVLSAHNLSRSTLTKENSSPSFNQDLFHSQQHPIKHDVIGLLATSTEWTKQSFQRFHASPLLLVGMHVDVEKATIKNLFINRNLQSRTDLLHFQVGKTLDSSELVIELVSPRY